MGVQDVDYDGDLWFFADADSHKVHEIEAGSPANAAFADSTAWVSVSGSAEVVRDLAKIKELWGPTAEAWFPDGPETPGVVLIVAARRDGRVLARPRRQADHRVQPGQGQGHGRALRRRRERDGPALSVRRRIDDVISSAMITVPNR